MNRVVADQPVDVGVYTPAILGLRVQGSRGCYGEGVFAPQAIRRVAQGTHKYTHPHFLWLRSAARLRIPKMIRGPYTVRGGGKIFPRLMLYTSQKKVSMFFSLW